MMEISQDFRDAFACSLSKRVLKERFLASGLTDIVIVCNFGNTLAATITFFSKCLKCDVDSRNGTKNAENVFYFQIIAFKLGVANSHILEQDTCHRQAMC